MRVDSVFDGLVSEFVARSVLSSAFETATGRPPVDQELEILTSAHSEYLTTFKANPDEAKKLLSTGDSPAPNNLDPIKLAALTTLANVILNLDEVLTKP